MPGTAILIAIMHDLQLVMQVCIPSAEAPSRIVVNVYLPETYPLSSPPVVELHGSAISADQQAEAIQHLEDIFQPGEVSQCCLHRQQRSLMMMSQHPADLPEMHVHSCSSTQQ